MKRLFSVLACLAVLLLGATAFAWPTWTGTATITVASDNNTSSAISIPRGCNNNIAVTIPTITTGTVAVHVSNDGTTYKAFYFNAGAGAAPVAFATGSGTHDYATEIPRGVTAYKYLRFETSAEQAANRTFTLYCN